MDANSYREKEERQVQVPQEAFHHTQEHLNDCIRHHQQILEYVKPNYFASNLNSWETSCCFQFTKVGFNTYLNHTPITFSGRCQKAE
jgi:hypothetical protein